MDFFIKNRNKKKGADLPISLVLLKGTAKHPTHRQDIRQSPRP